MFKSDIQLHEEEDGSWRVTVKYRDYESSMIRTTRSGALSDGMQWLDNIEDLDRLKRY